MTKIGFDMNDDIEKSVRKKSALIEDLESPMHNPEVNKLFYIYFLRSLLKFSKISVTLLRISF